MERVMGMVMRIGVPTGVWVVGEQGVEVGMGEEVNLVMDSKAVTNLGKANSSTTNKTDRDKNNRNNNS